jgi:hypothetical protein
VDVVRRAVIKPGSPGACKASGVKPPLAVERTATADDADAASTINANAPSETNLIRICSPLLDWTRLHPKARRRSSQADGSTANAIALNWRPVMDPSRAS